MAGDWIKFEVSTSDKPEVWAIADRLGIDADSVVGKLLRVWSWFDQHTQEGNANGNGGSVTSSVTQNVTKALLDRRVGVSGFCDAMISVGWMEDFGHSVRLPNFDRHNGKTAKTRAMTAKRVATHKTKTNATSVTSSVSDALPREEKRREEKNTNTQLREAFEKFLTYLFSVNGQKVDEIREEVLWMEVLRRGDQAITDIDFTIQKGCKSLQRATDDWQAIRADAEGSKIRESAKSKTVKSWESV